MVKIRAVNRPTIWELILYSEHNWPFHSSVSYTDNDRHIKAVFISLSDKQKGGNEVRKKQFAK